MKIHKESHLDHHLTPAQTAHIAAKFADRSESFFMETFELPDDLGTVPCGLYGPVMGDPPVSDAEATRARRGERAWQSRLVDRPARPTRMVTVIAGAHTETCSTCEGKLLGLAMSGAPGPNVSGWSVGCDHCNSTGKLQHACILYTAFGGPQAPQEPGDIRRQLEAVELERRERHERGEPDPSGGCSDEAERARLDPAIYGRIVALRAKRATSDAFWRDHALAK